MAELPPCCQTGEDLAGDIVTYMTENTEDYVLGVSLPRGRSPREKDTDDLIKIGEEEFFNFLSKARPEFEAVAKTVRDFESGAVDTDALGVASLVPTCRPSARRHCCSPRPTLRVVAGAVNEAMNATTRPARCGMGTRYRPSTSRRRRGCSRRWAPSPTRAPRTPATRR